VPTIGLVGGNSQVATEVALFLSLRPDIQVVPICRSSIGSAFLRHCGLSNRVGAMSDASTARALMAGLDSVADFSLPLGAAGEMRRRTQSGITQLVEQSPAACRVVYISTQMAFGMRQGETDRHYHFIAGTTYGATKRYGEHLVRRLARTAGKEAYVLRLGQVHGELQSVSQQMRAVFREQSKVSLPDTVSDTVFAYSIAEALANIAAGKEKPGVYTLMSTPDWHWRDIYDFYCEESARRPELHLYSCSSSRIPRDWLRAAQAAGKRVLLRHRESIGAYVLSRMPQTEGGILARYRLSNAARDISSALALSAIPSCVPVVGSIAGRRLACLTDSRVTMRDPAKEVKAILARAGETLRRVAGEGSAGTARPVRSVG
jgi:nucleoside-diphosphate-sugar epimerase